MILIPCKLALKAYSLLALGFETGVVKEAKDVKEVEEVKDLFMNILVLVVEAPRLI